MTDVESSRLDSNPRARRPGGRHAGFQCLHFLLGEVEIGVSGTHRVPLNLRIKVFIHLKGLED